MVNKKVKIDKFLDTELKKDYKTEKPAFRRWLK